jgi:hypothetical protein
LELSDLQYLMHQLGPTMPEIVAITQDDIDSWKIDFDEAISLQIEWQASPPCVLMSCAIGQPEAERREAVYASLLNANLLLTGIASVKLALSQPDNDVLLIGEYPLGDASITTLQASLSEYLSMAAQFSVVVAENPAKDLNHQVLHSAAMHHQRA